MSKVPDNLRYTKSHEWVRRESDGSLTVGITDYAQNALGDIVFVQLPDANATFSSGKECAEVESVKTFSDVYAPLAGEITDVNSALAKTPETINKDPYGEGWMFRMKPQNPSLYDSLLDAKGYNALLAAESH